MRGRATFANWRTWSSARWCWRRKLRYPVDVLPEHLLEAKGLRIRRDESGHLAADASLFEIVADYERRKIIEQLEASDWSQTAAAEALRVPLSTLNQKIKRLNIEIRKRTAG